jgi:hypothetical protein
MRIPCPAATIIATVSCSAILCLRIYRLIKLLH